MNEMMLVTTILAFVFSFLFALGGVGSALAFIPVMHWIGIPLDAARPVGLMINTVSMGGASVSNSANRRLDFRLAMPVIAASTLFAPAGAWSSLLISHKTVMLVFAVFLIFSSLMMLIYSPSPKKENNNRNLSILIPALTGVGAGFISGLLGVGSGMLISPMLIFIGSNQKNFNNNCLCSPIFIIDRLYSICNYRNHTLGNLIFTSVAVYFGGFLGTKIMHNHLKGKTVKKLLGFILLVISAKIIWGFFPKKSAVNFFSDLFLT